MITDKSRYGHDAVLDLNCDDSVQVLRTEPMTLTEQEQKIVQKYLGIALLEKSYIDANGHLMVVLSDGRTLDVGSARGLPGATPYLGENGNWFVEGVDTLQSARGLPGFTPYIGENEHWWIDETDTGIPARGIPLTEKADNTRFLRNDGTWQKVTPENIGAAQAGVVADHESRIEALEQRTVTAPYYTDDSVAYTKDVPADALPFASVDMVGGMTRKCTNLWSGEISAKSEPTVYTFDNGTMTLLRSYGAIQAFVWSKEKYKAGTYNLSFNLNGMGASSNFRILKTKNPVATNIGVDIQTLYSDGAYDIEFTLTEDGYIGFGTDVDNVKLTASNIMLNEGTTALPYEPYFDGLRSAPVTEVESVGENLFDMSRFVNTNGLNVFDDKIVVTASAVDMSINSTVLLKDFAPQLKVGDTVKFNAVTTGTSRYIYIGNVGTWGFGESRTITEKMLNSVVYFYASGLSTSATISKIMLNRGATALPYTPYVKWTLPIPAEVQALDGYGWGVNADCYNYIDWERKQFVKRVGKDTWNGTETDISFSDNTSFFAFKLSNESKQRSTGHGNKGVCSLYNIYEGADPSRCPDRSIMITPLRLTTDRKRVFVKDSRFTTVEDFKAFLVEESTKGNPLEIAYELAEPVITDISDLLPDDNLIGVEGGGTVTMVNEYGYDVPSKITYARLTWQ